MYEEENNLSLSCDGMFCFFSLSPAPPLLGCLLHPLLQTLSLTIYPDEGKGDRYIELHNYFPKPFFFFFSPHVAIK